MSRSGQVVKKKSDSCAWRKVSPAVEKLIFDSVCNNV